MRHTAADVKPAKGLVEQRHIAYPGTVQVDEEIKRDHGKRITRRRTLGQDRAINRSIRLRHTGLDAAEAVEIAESRTGHHALPRHGRSAAASDRAGDPAPHWAGQVGVAGFGGVAGVMPVFVRRHEREPEAGARAGDGARTPARAGASFSVSTSSAPSVATPAACA